MRANRQIVVTIFCLFVLFFLFEFTNIDIFVQEFFYDEVTQKWLLSHQKGSLLDTLFYTGIKKVIIVFGVFILFLYLYSFKDSVQRLKEYRSGLLIVWLSIVMVPLIVGGFLPIEIRFMAKKELFKNPLLAKFFRGLGAFPVERDANDLRAIKTALAALKNGENLGIFPEGTRNRTYKALPVKAGMAMLAHRTQTPILPVTVDTTFKWFKPIRMVIHPPVSLEAYYGQKLSNETFEKISQDIVDGLYADMHYYREAKLDKAP